MKTIYNTRLLVDADLHIKFVAAARIDGAPVYAQRSETELSFFVIVNNVVKYIRSIDDTGKVTLSNERVPVKNGRFPYVSAVGRDPKMEVFKPHSSLDFNTNELDNTIYVRQNDKYWSTLRDGRFYLAPRNRSCEHFSLQPTKFIELANANAILLVTDVDALDGSLARLNLAQINIVAALIDGADPVTLEKIQSENLIPTFDFNNLENFLSEGHDGLWLMIGNSLNRLEKISEYLRRRGIDENNIINFSIKMRIESQWLENMTAAVKDDCDFIVTGDHTALGLKTDGIINRHGINLAADGQDLRQSFLITRQVLKNNPKLKFVLIGLTPQLLSARDSFSECGEDGQYICVDDNSTLEQKIFDQMLNTNAEIVAVGNAPKRDAAQSSSLENILDDARKIDLQEKNFRRLEEFIRLCVEHGVRPIGVFMPLSPQIVQITPHDKLALMRRMLRALETPDGFTFIDLCDMPLGMEHFSDAEFLNELGASTFTNVLNYELHSRDILPFEDMRFVDYEKIYGLMSFLSNAQYKNMLNRIFAASVAEIKRKEKIKIGFVFYDSSMWCGDALYDMFARDERYETTVFACLRKDLGGPLVRKNHNRDVEMFRSKGFNVVEVVTNDDRIPQQDILLYLTPYFHYLPMALRTYMITSETLIAYIPYAIGMSILSTVSFKIQFIVWRMFTDTKWLRQKLLSYNRIDESRIFYSGLPKLDSMTSPHEINFEWKMTRPDAVKIIWAPHWSIWGRPYVRYATFQWNYKFMYEYAKMHPETSWVVKPHPNLFKSAVMTGVFPSSAAFDNYLAQWNALPNAKVVIGGYYQDVFMTADGIIHDSGSFVGESQYTHKPMLYLTRKTTKLNPLGTKIIEAGYTVEGTNFEGIAQFIEDVLIKKNDTTVEARRAVFDAELNYRKENGLPASEKIFETITQSFRR